MNSVNSNNHQNDFIMITENSKLTVGKIIFTLIYILIFPALLLFLSEDWFWVEGWIFSIWFTVLCFTTIIYLYRKDPALLAERYRKPGTANQKGWDKYVVYGLLIGFIAWIVIMPLVAKRYGWTTYFPLWLKILGGIGLILAFFFFYRSYTDNTFVSPLVRIQTEPPVPDETEPLFKVFPACHSESAVLPLCHCAVVPPKASADSLS